ncbi:C39 family peptidase [candidate division KSB1 bacterium]|nr:C39 family peptidase [candidate division KSB1 bacterium]MBL7093727.1 C39 family peptidase [candidate division KSB1 bacterium]
MSNTFTKIHLKIPHFEQEQNGSCLPACARMILDSLAITKTEAEIRKLLKTKPAGTNPLNIANLKELDIEIKVTFSSLDELLDHLKSKLPSIALLWTGEINYWDSNLYFDYLHAVVVVGFDKENIFVNDPAFSNYPQKIPYIYFLNAWSYSQHMLILLKRSE